MKKLHKKNYWVLINKRGKPVSSVFGGGIRMYNKKVWAKEDADKEGCTVAKVWICTEGK